MGWVTEIDVENCHREIIRQFALVLILEDNTQKLLADIKLAGIALERTCFHRQ
jgi:hypothetical protein